MRRFAMMLLLAAGWHCTAAAQELQPGFDAKEYLTMLALNFQQFESDRINPRIPVSPEYAVIYRSPDLGLRNRWNMWLRNDNKIAVISLRGSIAELPSWLENYYAAMIPATGDLQLNDSTRFHYQFSSDAKAHVHTGWAIGLGFMAPSIVEQIRAVYEKGVRSIIIIGHSQGGALATLTRSYLYYLTKQGALPADIMYKTYCSASPKVGNLFFSYDFDYITRGGWAFTVVNAADWVPETQFSIQTLADFNPLNPFKNITGQLKKQPVLVRWVIKHKYNRMKRGLQHAQQRFEHNLGGTVYKFVKKVLPQLREPLYVPDNNYQRAGVPIVLQPDSAYYKLYPNETNNVFMHHMFAPYQYLAQRY